MPRFRTLARRAGVLLALLVPVPASADHPVAESTGPNQPQVAEASDEGVRAIKTFRIPEGVAVEQYAAEPMVANPVAFGFDGRGRLFVAETFRHSEGVTDNRKHMNWLEADLASRSVADRVAMFRKYLGSDAESYAVQRDRLRLVEDRDGDGRADAATVFADNFRDIAAGIGAGVLARGGDVYYTCIPDLWLLRDTDGDGKADERKSLANGFGVHVGLLGHDLHGLRFGPDGKLYFSIGDRGTNAKSADRSIILPDTGAVFRCNPDGSELEVFCSGLRNPQELAFDERGNLFTVDNNSDAGDRARLVYLVEGGDTGWRISYQFIEAPNSRGPWLAEKLWETQDRNTASYLLPPLAHISDGPSGFAYDPGATLLPGRYRHHFFLADFRGAASTSGVRSFAVRPKGASFEMTDPGQFVWGLEATDVDFGPDGAVYISDWVEGWNKTGKGRIYRAAVAKPDPDQAKAAAEARAILAEGAEARAKGVEGKSKAERLAALLPLSGDMRVRQEVQFALAACGAEAIAPLARVAAGDFSASDAVSSAAHREPLARLHAIWGLGQVGRTEPKALEPLVALLDDGDAEVRAQAAKVFGDGAGRWPSGAAPKLVALIGDPNPRVRFFAAQAAGKGRVREAFAPLVRLLRENADQDPYLRHAGVMALVHLNDDAVLEQASRDDSAAVRLAALLAYRRQESPAVARFLKDAEPKLVLEAARAINDVPIAGGFDALAALKVEPGQPEALARRILNAHVRRGGPEGARALSEIARRDDLAEPIRAEALDALARWSNPPGRDRVIGLWRPLPDRPAAEAAAAVEPVLAALLEKGPDAVRRAAAEAAGALALTSASPRLAALAADGTARSETRIAALKALEGLDAAELLDAARQAVADRDSGVRREGFRLLARLRPAEAVPLFAKVLDAGSTAEKQGAFAALGGMKQPEADALLARWVDRLAAQQVEPEVRLDLIEAAESSAGPEAKSALERLAAAQPKDDPLGAYRVSLAGGNAFRGRRIFQEKAEVQCVRCHKFQGQGGEVGPELTGIGGRQPREYILESIIRPNEKIAEGFETVVVATEDGQVVAGVLKGEQGNALTLMTPEGKLLSIPKDQVEDRKRGASAMPDDVIKNLSRAELRDLVEFLSRSK